MSSFEPKIKLSYPEFKKHYQVSCALGFNLAYGFEEINGIDWYTSFRNKIFEARDQKKFLPLYRMGDGEYNFLLGKKIYELLPFHKLTSKQKLLKIRQLFLSGGDHKSGTSTDGLESYSKEEIDLSYNKYVNDLRIISKKGILALGLDSGDFYGKYTPFVLEVFKQRDIILNPANYFHVYHVYALFSSTDGVNLIKDQNVLIMTSLDDFKRQRFTEKLSQDGVKRLDFYSISPSKSMIETIDLYKIEKDIDLILIGAGVGSANIITQLKDTNVPCIDIGTVLGNYLNADRRYDRPFMLTDDQFDFEKVNFLNENQKDKVRTYLVQNNN
jgi:hypothetical protein